MKSGSSAVEVIGNQAAVAALREMVDAGRLGHAVILAGPAGVGKTTLAISLAERIVGSGWPGGILAHPDLWMEDAPEESIPIARIRGGGDGDLGLLEFLGRRPYQGDHRVAVLARAERLREDSANTLLKAIEEPPAGTHILLCTSSPETLPATILSRCQMVTLAPVGPDLITRWLVSQEQEAAPLAELAAALSSGRPGRARHLAQQPEALVGELESIEALLRAGGSGIGDVLQLADRLAPAGTAEGRERALLEVAVWTGFIRDVARVHCGLTDGITWRSLLPALQVWADALPLERLTEMLSRCLEASDALSHNAQPRLTYTTLLLDLLVGPPAAPATPVPPRPPELAAVVSPAPVRRGRRG